MNFLKRFLGLPGSGDERLAGNESRSSASQALTDEGASDNAYRGTHSGQSDVIRRYFELCTEIEEAKRDRDYDRAIRAARATYPILPEVVRAWAREYGSFDMVTSHAVHTAPRLMAVMEQPDGLRELRAVLETVKELRPWMDSVADAEAEIAVVPQIMAAIRADPGVLQSALKVRLPGDAGARASNLAAWLEKAGRIMRVRKGSSYQLYTAGHVFARSRELGTAPSPPSAVAQRPKRTVRSASKAEAIDFSRLTIVRLPQAPARWETQNASRDSASAGDPGDAAKSDAPEPRFSTEGAGWSVVSEEKLPRSERPDPAFKEAFHTARFTHWLDPKGRREGYETAASVLRVTGPDGNLAAERGLTHDVYRSDVNADGTGILFLSRDGFIHGYDQDLAIFIEERLVDLPEYQAQAARFGIQPHELKNHTRCVATSADRSRYLVTVVDEAWCLDVRTQQVIWGFRMPSKEGWTRHVANRSERVGTSVEVQAALTLMGLDLPVTPEAITRQYRALAMKWHPDRNPGDPAATARFQQLGAAVELLTGADLSGLSERQIERVTYEQMLSTATVPIPDGRGGTVNMELSIGMMVSESYASDWIYAANLGADGRAFLAGYSGKVVIVSPRGVPEMAYDIGAVPRHVADSGERLYILTDTRLYVVSGDRLEALVDVAGASSVIVGEHGFALLEPKSLTWYSPQGQRVGSVVSKQPLRRAFSSRNGLVVETRQHRAVVSGAPSWWRDDPS